MRRHCANNQIVLVRSSIQINIKKKLISALHKTPENHSEIWVNIKAVSGSKIVHNSGIRENFNMGKL